MNYFSNIFIVILIVLNFSNVKSQSLSCQTIFEDTLKYVEASKTSALAVIGVNSINDGGAYGYAGYGQLFEAPDSITLTGFCFYGYVNSGNSDTVVCRLYTADQSGIPNIELDSVVVNVPLNIGYSGLLNDSVIQICVNFDSPHVIEGDYIVSVENFSSSDIYLTRNIDGDGASEDLALTYYRGISDPSFDGWYKTFPFGAGWNFDLLFEPLVEYTIYSEISLSNDTLCLGDTLVAAALVIPFDDSVFYHRMYNQDFSNYSGYTVSNSYDYGDSSSDTTGIHAYSLGGMMNVQSYSSLSIIGWTNQLYGICMDSVYVNSIELNLGLDTFLCVGESLILDAGSQDIYDWNTGQTTAIIQVGPFLSPDTIIYVVEVINGGCESSDTIEVWVDQCFGVNEMNSSIKVYPIPAKEFININSENYNIESYQIYDLYGRLMKIEKIYGNKWMVGLNDLKSGVYVLKIET